METFNAFFEFISVEYGSELLSLICVICVLFWIVKLDIVHKITLSLVLLLCEILVLVLCFYDSLYCCFAFGVAIQLIYNFYELKKEDYGSNS